jgi:hypothetical protein
MALSPKLVPFQVTVVDRWLLGVPVHTPNNPNRSIGFVYNNSLKPQRYLGFVVPPGHILREQGSYLQIYTPEQFFRITGEPIEWLLADQGIDAVMPNELRAPIYSSSKPDAIGTLERAKKRTQRAIEAKQHADRIAKAAKKKRK